MKNSFLFIWMILALLCCKKVDQVYKDSLGNAIDETSIKSDIRYRFQGTYALSCTYGYKGSSDATYSYDAKVGVTPFKQKYTFSPLKFADHYGSDGSIFVVLVDTSGHITIPYTNLYANIWVSGTGTIDLSANTLHYYIKDANNFDCSCYGTKK